MSEVVVDQEGDHKSEGECFSIYHMCVSDLLHSFASSIYSLTFD
jgi:hypothetical protein